MPRIASEPLMTASSKIELASAILINSCLYASKSPVALKSACNFSILEAVSSAPILRNF
jgi:hypothetical protein